MNEYADPRASAIATAHAYFDDGAFIDDLARLVEVPTVSQDPEAMPVLHRYLQEMIAPYLSEDGFSCEFFDNPEPDGTPLMIAERHEDDSLPTVLVYGHGDVVPGQENKWRDGLGPWKPVVEEDRIYGRGTAD
ncbi:MAG: M20/M25/M40 family metallo-hydrolase, partial [Pseudomonadota bacterium]|nr:M20/M25/M40 family metallo-hydrolase [Pseudomonadota bacterium]